MLRRCTPPQVVQNFYVLRPLKGYGSNFGRMGNQLQFETSRNYSPKVNVYRSFKKVSGENSQYRSDHFLVHN